MSAESGAAFCADLEDLVDVELDPVGEGSDVGRGFVAERGEAVLDLGRDGGKDGAGEKAVGFKMLEGLGEHFLADAADGAADLREAMGAFEKKDENERSPAGGEMVEDRA